MNRKEKIKLLKQISEGKTSVFDLHEPIEYSVWYNMSLDGMYRVSEMRQNPRPNLMLNKSEFEAWKQQIEEQNRHRSEPHTINIILIEATPNCSNMFYCKELPNCLEGCGCKRKTP